MCHRPMLLIIVVAAGFVAGCGGGGGGVPAEPATVTGTVRDDASLDPVANAQVTIGATTAQTNANGYFTIATTAGTRTIVITKAAYQTQNLTRTLVAGTTSVGTRYLRPALLAGNGAASGRVRLGGANVAGARVTSGGAEATTRADGTYGIYNLQAGERGLLAVDADGAHVGSVAVQIVADQATADADITLNLSPPDLPQF